MTGRGQTNRSVCGVRKKGNPREEAGGKQKGPWWRQGGGGEGGVGETDVKDFFCVLQSLGSGPGRRRGGGCGHVKGR